MRPSPAPLVLLCLVSSVAQAHDADVIFVQPQVEQGGVREVVTLTAAALGELAPVDADHDGLLTAKDLEASGEAIVLGFWNQAQPTAGGQPCTLAQASAALKDGDVQLEGAFNCGPGELRQDFRVLAVLPPNYTVSLGRFGAAQAGPVVRAPQTSITLRAEVAAPTRPPEEPVPVWVWLSLLVAPFVLVLVERGAI